MNSRMWMRQVIPISVLFLGLAAYAAMVGIPLIVMWWLTGNPGGFPLRNPAGLGVLGMMAIAYGGYRVAAFHPVYRKDYCDWLKATPWRFGQPLPLGPIHIVLQDIINIGVLTGLSMLHVDGQLPIMASLFLGGYLFNMTLALFCTQQNLHAFLLLYGFGGLLYVQNDPLEILGLLVMLYVIAVQGLNNSLRSFDQWTLNLSSLNRIAEKQQEKLLGWPHDHLAPKQARFAPGLITSSAIAGLFGWVAGGLLVNVPPKDFRDASFMLMALVPVAGLVRLVTYLNGYAPPLSLLGRLRTGRLLIPGFDVVFVAPLLMLAIQLTFVKLVERGFVFPIAVVSTLIAIGILIGLQFPPRLDAWRLTGNHRISPINATFAHHFQQTK